MAQESLSKYESEEESVKSLAEMSPTGLYVLEDAVEVAAPFGDEAVEKVQRKADTFMQKGAIPSEDNTMDDEAVGAYEVAQAAIEAKGGESLPGSGMGSGFYARTAYRRNMRRLPELVDGVEWDELDVAEPSSMEE